MILMASKLQLRGRKPAVSGRTRRSSSRADCECGDPKRHAVLEKGQRAK